MSENERDLAVCEDIDANVPLLTIARTYDVPVEHVRDLEQELKDINNS